MKIYVRDVSLKNKIVVFFMIQLLFLSVTFPKKLNPNSARIKKILEKSLIFPGWGQLIEKQYLKGIFFMSSEILCITQAIINNNRANKFYKKYREANNSNDAAAFRLETERFDKRRNTFILAGTIVWVANMIEIYIYTKKKIQKKG